MPAKIKERNKRLPLKLTLDVRGESASGQPFWEQTQCRNVSGTGICFETRQKVLVNTRLRLSIKIPASLQKHFDGRGVYETEAIIVRLEATEGQSLVRVGARFLDEARKKTRS